MAMDSKAVSRQALATARTNQAAPAIALSGILSNSAQALEKAAALGWNPAMPMPGGRDAFSRALEAPSPDMILWLLEKFPLAAMGSPTFAKGDGHSSWKSAAMLAAEAFGVGIGGVHRWAKACGASDEAADYFSKSLQDEGGSLWTAPPADSVSDKIQHLKAGFAGVHMSSLKSPELFGALAKFYERECVLALSAGSSDEVEQWIASIDSMLANMLEQNIPLAPGKPLWDKIPKAMLAMGLAPINEEAELGGDKLLWDSPSSSERKRRASAGEMGYYALMMGSLPNVSFALSQGWIRPTMVSSRARFEHPAFIAWQQRESEEKAGKPLPMDSRWQRCREILEKCELPEAERTALLSLCDRPDPTAWSAGKPTHVNVQILQEASPMEILLAGSNIEKLKRVGRQRVERVGSVAEALSEAGFSVEKALSGFLGRRAAGQGSAGLAHVKRLAEREILSKATEPAPVAKGPRRSL